VGVGVGVRGGGGGWKGDGGQWHVKREGGRQGRRSVIPPAFLVCLFFSFTHPPTHPPHPSHHTHAPPPPHPPAGL
jgi:hypothetical protein